MGTVTALAHSTVGGSEKRNRESLGSGMTSAEAHRALTLTTVALEAGVAVSTVSKVINGRDDVSAETRSKVLAALAQTGYKSPLQHRRSSAYRPAVDVVIDSLNSACDMEVLNGILEHAAEAGIEVVLNVKSRQGPSPLSEADRAQRLLNEGRCGLVIVTSAFDAAELEAFHRKRIPTVVIDFLNPPQGDLVSIGIINFAGGKDATSHLLDLGHRRIAYLGGPEGVESSQARLHGYMAALRTNGLPVEDRYILSGTFRSDHGAQGMQTLLQLERPPTAIFAACDSIAFGVLAEARRRNIRVPEEMSLVGFDGTYQAENSVPALTSVTQPFQKMGWAGLRCILQQMRGDALDSRRVEMATTLVIRESTAPPATMLS
jgi:LacI family transcriptional regulator